jgi:glutaredoxin 3
MTSGKEYIEDLIKTKKVVVISKSYCPFCGKAKDALKKYNIKADSIVILEIENRKDMDEIQDYLKKLTGARSVPRVFIDGVCIGGGDETSAAHKNGKLQKLLEKAGALEE